MLRAGGGGGGVASFNSRTGAVTQTSGDITTALGFTPLNPANNLSDVNNLGTSLANLGGVSVLRSYIAGCTLSNNGNTSVNVAAGQVADDTNAAMYSISAGTIDCTTTGANGLDTGSLGNSLWYHAFAIAKAGAASPALLMSQSPGTSATVTITIASPGVVSWTKHGLQAGAPVTFTTTGALPTGITAGTQYYVIAAGLTVDAFEISTSQGGSAVNTSGSQSGTHTATAAPIMPTTYTLKRRLGSVLTDGSAHILAFTQVGDIFYWGALMQDGNNVALAATAALFTLTVPTGVKVRPLMRFGITAANLHLIASSPDEPDVAPGATPILGNGIDVDGATYPTGFMGSPWLYTNTSAQFRARATASNSGFYWWTRGWIDDRGRYS